MWSKQTKKTKLVIGILAVWAVIWVAFFLLAKPLVSSMYHGKSFSFLNNIISGQNEHTVDFYLDFVQVSLLKMFFYSLVLCLFIMLPINVQLPFISVGVVFLILELSLMGYESFWKYMYRDDNTHKDILWQHDSLLGWKHQTDKCENYVNRESQFRTKVCINSKGLRDEEYSYTKPAGVTRVLMIGDSGVAGFEVEKEYVVDTKLEELLDKHGEYEVLNTGVRGYGTDQSYLYLTNELYKYQPNIVVYVFFANDPENNISIHRPYRTYGKSYFIVDKEGRLILKGTPVPKKFEPYNRWLLTDPAAERVYNDYLDKETERNLLKEEELKYYRKHRDIFREVSLDWDRFLRRSYTLRWIKAKIHANKELEKFFAKKFGLIPAFNSRTVRDKTEVLKASWGITDPLLKAMADYVEAMPAEFLVFEFNSNPNAVEPSRLQQVCEKLGIAYTNSFKEIREAVGKGQKVHIFRDEHWNPQGHQIAADRLYEYFLERQWVE